ncbi:hypothetical protein PHYPSEUDO_014756 [Phytophthora pseudosyringae]|uniref:Uncharacterized protein n=1 Tax=Phytophthora pseudosyringae TaxID=221518 RepID=A0A8T1W032_9STRA|nr:hypothetical protein PHYPSEUDO_014756 [Phytophthora pseudosyringae]
MSRRSSLSATVVPTAAEHLPDPSADNSVHVATTEQRVEVAPENQVSVTDLQTSSASQASVTTAPVVVDAQQQVPAAKPCPGSPLAIAQSIHQNMHATAKRVKNYRALVNSFKHMQPFSRSADGSYPAKVVYAHTSKLQHHYSHFKSTFCAEFTLFDLASMPRERSPSRRSITSATVIPIATDGHSGATPSDNADNAGTPDYTAETEQDTVVVHDSPTQVAGDNDPDSVMTPTEVHTEDSQRQSSPPKHAPLPVSQRIPMSVELTHRGSFKLVNNYKALATSFRQLQPFARRPDGTYPASITCVMCATGKPTSVFFPCQHMCVCSKCIQSNDMSPDCSMHLERW